jgi:predicted RNA binding protein YcfA (HicA-like mRNA interferase family)
MPRKIRDLLKDLRAAGFSIDRQKGSHRQFKHPTFKGTVTLSGADNGDAKNYQERQIAKAIAEAKAKD